jgi:prepilin-type N-terminal cleavage/methylation domain-containing protein
MQRLRTRLQRDDSGFTLIELLVAIGLSVLVTAVAGSTIVQSLKVQRRQVEHVHALNDAKKGFERMTRELRAADPLLLAEPQAVDMTIVRDGTTATYRFRLVNGTAGRRNLTVQVGAGPVRTLVRDLVDQPVFTFLGNGGGVLPGPDVDERLVRTVRVDLVLRPPFSTTELELSQDVVLRNWRTGA